MESILELKTISSLQNYSFFIPSYQRGYKWSTSEVRDLLNDINEFKPRLVDETDEKTWYCLQPIVIKKRENGEYEVIDGQQRLTTIFLILYYLNQDFVEEKRDKLFSLRYETRLRSGEFLNSISKGSDYSENVDFYYMHNAYSVILQWFDSKPDDFDKQDYRSKFKFHAKVIWYETEEENSISIFTRINIGKIPLTNAELIKALFLNSSNFEKNKVEKLRLKQLEIATEWDMIEHSLQDDRLWYFLCGNRVITNRIEFIFDLISDNNGEVDNYATFRFFNRKFIPKSQDTIEKNWKEVKDYFQRFDEWYRERELYHKIGYLICVESVTIKQLYYQSSILTKSEFSKYLDGAIRKGLEGVVLQELQYGQSDVKKVLLLYNILTMLNSPQDNSYFPFNLYKNENWDIEHITSVKDVMPDKNRGMWLADAMPYIDDTTEEGSNLKSRSEKCDVTNDIEFKGLFEEIVSHFNSGIKDDEIDDISNLTLLDSQTNRGYKNAVFPLKRKTIIDRDKAGTFIPICTKNVFLKYFSEYPPKISFWTEDDRQKYEADIYSVLKNHAI